ncbi:MAG: hypothetical protein LC641_02650 [Spirochaeta sp.]|nr:hypothetical protein [Spirochaeta sp.]
MKIGAYTQPGKRVVVVAVVLFGFVVGFATTQQSSPWAPAYPGSVAGDARGSHGYRSFYLTRDPQSAVVEFYRRHRGASPTTGTADNSFFQYSSSTFEVSADDGVHIYENTGRSDGAKIVLRKLEDFLYDTHGVFDRAEYNRIVTRFGDMALRYPLSDQRDGAGLPVPVDHVILQRYEQRYDAFMGDEPEDDESVEARFNALIAQGRFQDAAALMQSHSGDVVGVYQRENSREVVDLWISCLEEMERHAYPVVIQIGHRR